MALINCPECGRQISDKAENCPGCGLPAAYFYNEAANSHNLKISDTSPANETYSVTDQSSESHAESTASSIRNALITFEQDYNNLFSPTGYIDSKKAGAFRHSYDTFMNAIPEVADSQSIAKFITETGIDEYYFSQFQKRMSTLDDDIAQHNNRYVEWRLNEYKDYFDHILDKIDPNIKLDEEQRRAVITDDNHCLLVAGAGAGKTTTMAAKVKYLVEKQQVNPQDIVVISYTNKAIDELKERINKGLGIPVTISTFHAFAFDIVKKTAELSPEVNFQSYQIIHRILSETIFDNKALMKNLVLFLGYYFDLPEDAFNFKTLNEYHLFKAAADYETIKSSIGEYINSVANKRQKKVKTITGEYLRSMQEVQIANFLYLNGIEYEYEKTYEHNIHKARKKYTPDFFIKQGEITAYIEHFGLNQNMQSNIFSPQQLATYQKSIGDKRRIHKYFNTNLIETWSFYNDRRPLLDHLKEELTLNGFVLRPLPYEEVYRKLVDTSNDKYIVKLIWFMMNFIEQYKTSGFDDSGFAFLRTRTDNVRNLLFLDIAEVVYGFYQKTLKEQNQIDFADMINDANSLLLEMKRQGLTLSYRYIIIDEFQDIARQRFNLTKRLADISDAKVIAVGDDWQSIFAFAGSDISLFTRFIELMGSGKEMKITHTYRNSQELIDIAGQFVQKNSLQIRKKLISPKSLKEPVKLISYDDSNKANINLANAVISAIGQIVQEFGPKQSILLIGRYGFDIDKLAKTNLFSIINVNELKCWKYPKIKLIGMTAHASKGLGYDQVIILNMLESRFGFPSQIEDDPIIKMVTVEDRSIPFAEERRLFYVALTRTKNRVYIMAPLHKPSRFLVELINDYNLPHAPDMNLSVVNLFKNKCPKCGFPLKFEFNKNYGLPLHICTNEVEICDFMTNDLTFMKDIYKCPSCSDGYMIVKHNRVTKQGFYGCTNFNNEQNHCKNSVTFENLHL